MTSQPEKQQQPAETTTPTTGKANNSLMTTSTTSLLMTSSSSATQVATTAEEEASSSGDRLRQEVAPKSSISGGGVGEGTHQEENKWQRALTLVNRRKWPQKIMAPNSMAGHGVAGGVGTTFDRRSLDNTLSSSSKRKRSSDVTSLLRHQEEQQHQQEKSEVFQPNPVIMPEDVASMGSCKEYVYRGVIFPSLRHHRFKKKKVENLFDRFFMREKKLLQISLNLLYIFIKGVMLIMVGIFGTNFTINHVIVIILPITFHLIVLICILISTSTNSKQSFSKLRLYGLMTWVCLTSSELVHTLVVVHDDDDDDVIQVEYMSRNFGNLLVIIYVTYTMLPFPLMWAVICTTSSTVTSLICRGVMTSSSWWSSNSHVVVACVTSCISAHVIGFYTNFLIDRSRRKTFVETRRCVSARVRMEKENKNQESLILSVIPHFIAMRLINDFSTMMTSSTLPRFDMKSRSLMMTSSRITANRNNPMYVEKYDNVSILFADVRGFTKLSTKLSPQKLVSTLNELFGKFDRLSQRHSCLRIKILGDCYYCVSGLPQRRHNHAHSCVKLAFDMVRVIKWLRHTLHYDLQMRIGIHTGSVLCGVIGNHKWQFDIWSEDVKIANMLEAGGIPDRVHISHSTLLSLDGAYEVEPGDGQSRNWFLRENQIETYLIVDNKHQQQTTRFDDVIPPQSPSAAMTSSEGDDDVMVDEEKKPKAEVPSPGEAEVTKVAKSRSMTSSSVTTTRKKMTSQTSDPTQAGGSGEGTSPPSTLTRERNKSRWKMMMTSASSPKTSDDFTDDPNDVIKLASMVRKSIHTKESPPHQPTSQVPHGGGRGSMEMRMELPFASMMRNHGLKHRRRNTAHALQSVFASVSALPGNHLTRACRSEFEETNTRMEKEILNHTGCHLGQENIKEYRVEFKDSEMESIYMRIRDELFKTNFLTSFVLLICILIQQFLIQHSKFYGSLINLIFGLIIFACLFLLIMAEEFEYFPTFLRHSSRYVQENLQIRRLLIFISFSVLILSAISTMLSCKQSMTSRNGTADAQQVVTCNRSQDDDDVITYRFTSPNSICNHPSIFFINGILVLLSCAIFRIKHVIKFALLLVTCLVFTLMTVTSHEHVFRNFFFLHCGSDENELKGQLTTNLALLWSFAICLYYQGRRMEYTNRLDLLRKLQAQEEINKMKKIQTNNHQLLRNIIPEHVTHHFLGRNKDHEELYSCGHDCVGIMFASIPNFDDCKLVKSKLDDGELLRHNHRDHDYAHFCLRLLNEIIFDFDQLITQEQFRCLEKIKTIGSTYMAASGLTPHNLHTSLSNDVTDDNISSSSGGGVKNSDVTHLCMLAHFALLLKRVIDDINSHTSNNLKIRIGMAFGPVVAGVIGAKKPQFDIWGQAVNLASRMDSTGLADHIQVPEEMYLMLKDRGFNFTYRSMTSVKGIGMVPTYFLTGCSREAAKRVGMSRALDVLGSVVGADGKLILADLTEPSTGSGHYSLAHVVYRLVQVGNRRRRYGTATEC